MLGHRFAAESAGDRANGCTYHGAYRPGSDRAGCRTGGDTACRCSKADANRVGTRSASNRVEVRPSPSRGVMVHVVLRCTVKEEAMLSGRLNTVCTVPHPNEGVITPVKGRALRRSPLCKICRERVRIEEFAGPMRRFRRGNERAMSRGVMFKFLALCRWRRTQVRASGWHLAALCRVHLLDGHANFDRSVPQLVMHNLFLGLLRA
jgi:hypothetical protein